MGRGPLGGHLQGSHPHNPSIDVKVLGTCVSQINHRLMRMLKVHCVRIEGGIYSSPHGDVFCAPKPVA